MKGNYMDDLYLALGVKKTASRSEIKSAYRKLARRFHPDHNLELESAEKFNRIEEAYRTLSDPKKRKDYDLLMASALTDKPGQFVDQLWQKMLDDLLNKSRKEERKNGKE